MDINLDAPISTLFVGNKRDFKDMQRKEAGMLANDNANYSVNEVGLNVGSNVDAFHREEGTSYSGYYWRWWEPYREYYTNIYPVRIESNDFEVAFHLAKVLVDEKMVKERYMNTVGDFFKLMDVIVKELKRY